MCRETKALDRRAIHDYRAVNTGGVLPDSWDETAVILGLRDGQRDAWEALYDQYSTRVWRYVVRVIGIPEKTRPGNDGSRVNGFVANELPVVADVVQETFLAAARSARQFDPERGTLWSWLAGIAHHHVLQHWRRQRRSSVISPLLADANRERESEARMKADSPLEQLERRELAESVRTVLSELSDEYALLLMSKYFEDLSLEEMTRHTGGTLESVRSKLARARREFRERFGRHQRATRGVSPQTKFAIVAPDESN